MMKFDINTTLEDIQWELTEAKMEVLNKEMGKIVADLLSKGWSQEVIKECLDFQRMNLE